MPLTTHILPAQVSDIPVLNQLAWAAKGHWGYPQDWMNKWRPELEVKPEDFDTKHIFKLVRAGEILGFTALEETEAHYEILHLWIRPDHMGKGYGRQLVIRSLAEVVRLPKPIIVVSDPHAETFYARLGFVTFDKEESYPPGRFLPVMRKDLPDLPG